MVALKVLTAFKKRRKKKLEEERELAAREKRKTLWRRLGFKLRVFNMFAKKIDPDESLEDRLRKLKKKLGNNSLNA